MKISQEFTVARPLPVVWAFFKDAPEVATCLPGAEYTGSPSEGMHTGRVKSRIGPFQSNFEGEAHVIYDDVTKTVHVEGKGVDKKGASRSRMSMDCRLSENGTDTKVCVDADIQLSGAIAQFGRTGLLTEVANVLVADFVRNAEAKLAAPASADASNVSADLASVTHDAPLGQRSADAVMASGEASLSVVQIMVRSFKAWLRSLFRSAPQS